MTQDFALDFPARSDLSKRRHLDVSLDEILDMVRSDLDRRRSTYPQMVSRGRMDRADADRRIATWTAIAADIERDRAMRCRRAVPDTAEWTGHWSERVAEIRRELSKRRATYPQWIDSPTHPMTVSQAVVALERLDALYHRYWVELNDFSGPDVPPHDDHARIAFIARAERVRLAPGGSDQLDLNEEQHMWHLIQDLVDRQIAGRRGPDDRDMAWRAAKWTVVRCEQLIGETESGRLPACLYPWYLYTDAWLMARHRA